MRAEGKLRRVGDGAAASRELPGAGAWGPEKAPDLHWSPERRGGGCLPPPPLPPHPLPPAPPSSLLLVPTSVGTAGVLRKDNARVKKMGLAAGLGAGEGRESGPRAALLGCVLEPGHSACSEVVQ